MRIHQVYILFIFFSELPVYVSQLWQKSPNCEIKFLNKHLLNIPSQF